MIGKAHSKRSFEWRVEACQWSLWLFLWADGAHVQIKAGQCMYIKYWRCHQKIHCCMCRIPKAAIIWSQSFTRLLMEHTAEQRCNTHRARKLVIDHSCTALVHQTVLWTGNQNLKKYVWLCKHLSMSLYKLCWLSYGSNVHWGRRLAPFTCN